MRNDPAVIIAAHGMDPTEAGLLVRVMTITPEIASEWLADNGKHREMKPKLTKKYARRMKHGQWVLNGKTIVIDRNGRLIGGQHRLSACAESGNPFQSLVVYGVDPAVLDQEKETS